MADIIQNNIRFSVDNETLAPAGSKTTKFGNNRNGDFSEEALEQFDGKVQPFVNAVEIDWNGAQIGES